MTPKEYLQQYEFSVRQVRAIQDHIDSLRAMAERTTPAYGASEGSGSHAVSDKLGAAVAKIIDAEERLGYELELLEATEREVSKTISQVSDGTLRTLLYERYINCKKWEQIAVDMNYSFRGVTKMHGRALQAVQEIMMRL